jgi:hypothetical protein
VRLAGEDRLAEAEEAFVRADASGHAVAAFNLGVLLGYRGETSGAAAAYRRADERGDADGAFEVGMLLAQQDHLVEAEEAFARAHARGHDAAAHNLAVLREYRQSNKDAEAGPVAAEPAPNHAQPLTEVPPPRPEHARPFTEVAPPPLNHTQAITDVAESVDNGVVPAGDPAEALRAGDDGSRLLRNGAPAEAHRRRRLVAGLVVLAAGIGMIFGTTALGGKGSKAQSPPPATSAPKTLPAAATASTPAASPARLIVSGTVTPAGSPVTVDVYRVSGPGSRRLVEAEHVVATGGSFRARISPPSPGRYVMVVRTARSAQFAAAASPPVEFTVPAG